MSKQSELVEILNRYAKAYYEAKYESRLNTCEWALDEAEQAILNWHNKQVLEIIGEDEQHKDWCAANRETICLCGEVVKKELRAEQRNKLKESKDE